MIDYFDLRQDMVKGGKMVAAARKGSIKPLPRPFGLWTRYDSPLFKGEVWVDRL